MDIGFLRISCEGKRRAVVVAEIVVLPVMGLSLVIVWHRLRDLVVVLSANEVLWHGALNGGFSIAETDYFQSRNLSLSWNQDLKFLVIGCLYLYFNIDSAVQPNSPLTCQGSS